MRFATTLLAAAVSVAGVAGEEAEKTKEVCVGGGRSVREKWGRRGFVAVSSNEGGGERREIFIYIF